MMNGFGITLFQDNGMTIIRHKSTTFFLIVQEMIPKKRPTDAFLYLEHRRAAFGSTGTDRRCWKRVNRTTIQNTTAQIDL